MNETNNNPKDVFMDILIKIHDFTDSDEFKALPAAMREEIASIQFNLEQIEDSLP